MNISTCPKLLFMNMQKVLRLRMSKQNVKFGMAVSEYSTELFPMNLPLLNTLNK